MLYRKIEGVTDPVSVISFGCGPGAALMVSDDLDAQDQAITIALEGGINFFDTAAFYGDGRSETALGAALRRLDASDKVIVLTKVQVQHDGVADLANTVLADFDKSRQRLQRDVVEILFLHNRIGEPSGAERSPSLTVDQILGPNGVLEAFRKLRDDGAIGTFGFSTFRGDPRGVATIVDEAGGDVINASFNLLNPSAGYHVGPGYASNPLFEPPDYDLVIDRAHAKGIATVVIQPLAAGQLGRPDQPELIESMRAFSERNGLPLVQLAARMCLSKPGVASVIWGFKRPEQVAAALEAGSAAPLEESIINSFLAELHVGE